MLQYATIGKCLVMFTLLNQFLLTTVQSSVSERSNSDFSSHKPITFRLQPQSVKAGLGQRPLMLKAGIKVPDHALGGALHVGSSNDGSVERAAERLSTLSLSLSLSASVGFGLAGSLCSHGDIWHGR